MRIGIPRETSRHEHRVGLTPFGVSRLVNLGHEVYIERGAGKDCHFTDEDYGEAGAHVVYSTDEAYQRAELVCRVGMLTPEDVERMPPGLTVAGFLHVAMMSRGMIDALAEKQVSLVGYEILRIDGAGRAVMRSMSELAGQMVVHCAAHLLEYESGGRGVILGGVPGIAPATVLILGSGVVGRKAAALAAAAGAHVIVLDTNLEKLRRVLHEAGPHVVTALATPRNLRRFTAIADVVIGAVAIPGGRAPFLVTEEMVRQMKPGSVILDVSIDQGGCVETSRPTTPDNPTFKVHGVTHFCVPNMTANAPRTASRALTIAALPFLTRIAGDGLEAALAASPGFREGVYMYRGRMINELAAAALGLSPTRLEDLLS